MEISELLGHQGDEPVMESTRKGHRFLLDHTGGSALAHRPAQSCRGETGSLPHVSGVQQISWL